MIGLLAGSVWPLALLITLSTFSAWYTFVRTPNKSLYRAKGVKHINE